jgi:hypothetical protein
VVDAVRLAVLFKLAWAVDAATTRATVRVAAVDAHNALARVRHARAQWARPLTDRWRHLGLRPIITIIVVVLSRDLLRRRRRASVLAVRATSSWHWW